MAIDANYFDGEYFDGETKTTAREMIQGLPNDPVAAGIAQLLIKQVPGVTAGKTLEFGCGRGAVVRALRKQGVKAFGFDISCSAQERLFVPEGDGRPMRTASTRIDDATKEWEFSDSTFELVYSIEVLEHIPEDKIPFVLSEAYRVLKPRGYLVCSIATEEDLKRVERILERHPEQRDESHVTVKSMEWWRRKAEEVGFKRAFDVGTLLLSNTVPIPCSPYHSRLDRDEHWDPLDDSPFKMYGRFAWSLLVRQKPLEEKRMVAVKLTYFKANGTFYTDDEFVTSHKPLFQIFKDVRKMLQSQKRPGLVDGPCEFHVLVEVPEHEQAYPHLIVLNE